MSIRGRSSSALTYLSDSRAQAQAAIVAASEDLISDALQRIAHGHSADAAGDASAMRRLARDRSGHGR
jgi:hypothetical protein